MTRPGIEVRSPGPFTGIIEKRKRERRWSAICRSRVSSRLWWDRVFNICKFRSARSGIKEELWGEAVVASQQNCANQYNDAASENMSERKKERQDRWRAVKRFYNCMMSSIPDNTNNHVVSGKYFYLIILICLHTVIWLQITILASSNKS